MEAIVNPSSRGSLLHADHPQNGVLIPRRFTLKEHLDWFAIAAAIVAAQILGLAVGIDGIMGSLNGR
jgi:hypothetical protein